MQEVRDLLIRFRSDTKDIENGASKVASILGGINSNFLKIGAVAAGSAVAISALFKAIDRGGEIGRLTDSFQNLQAKVGSLANNELAKLREVTDGVISDFDLMREANKAMLAGVDPERFNELTSSVKNYASTLGLTEREVLQKFTQAISTGNDSILEQLGITVNAKKTIKDYADSLGVATSQLDELQIRELKRVSISDAVKKGLDEQFKASGSAEKEITRLGVAFDNTFDVISRLVDQNPLIVGGFQSHC